MHSLQAVLLLLLTVLAKAELPSPFHPVTDVNPACPEVQHYYRVLPAAAGEAGRSARGRCHRCYCQESGTAACWPKEDKRCVEAGRIRRRARRSIFGLSNLVFGNKASKFFKEEVRKECVPGISFSDGCPPADWCMGCTVCDCDSKGQWDCHIMSFCSGNEKKKRINGSKVPVPRSIITKNKQKEQRAKKLTKKAVPKQTRKPKTRKGPQTTKKPNKQVKKILHRKSNNQNKNQKKPTPKKVVAKKAKKVIFKPKPTAKRTKPTKKPKSTTRRTKPTRKTIPTKKPKPIKKTKTTKKPKTTKDPKRNNKHIKKTLEPIAKGLIEQNTPNPTAKRSNTQIRKVIRRVLSKRESNPNLNEISDAMSVDSVEKTEMGRKIVKKVLSTLEKLMAKQMVMIQNKTNILRSQQQDCPKVKVIKKKKKKEKPKQKTIAQMTLEEIRQRKMENYINRNSWRVKRDAFDLVEINTANNNESKMYEVTNDDVKYLVKEIDKPSTVLYVESDVIRTTLSNVSDTSENGNNVLTSTEKQKRTTEMLTRSDTRQIFNTTESNLKYYEYFPDNTETTSHTVKILANNEDTTSKITESRSQNNSLNKFNDYTTQNILTGDHNNKTLLILDKNKTVKNITIFSTENIHSNSIDTLREYTYYTSQITIPNVSKSINGFNTTMVVDEIKIIQPHTEKSKFKQLNKTAKSKNGNKSDDEMKNNNSVNNRYKSSNLTAPNKMRVANLSINDADLIKLIKNKIKNRKKKNKLVSVHKNITKKGTTNFYKITTASSGSYHNLISNTTSSGSYHNLISNTTNNNTIEKKGSLQKLLENLITRKKDSVTLSEKKPKYSVFKYLRNIFKKIFSPKRDNHTTHKTNEGYTLEVLCDNVGACFKNDHLKVALRSKLHDLNSETEKVFKTIKIIKSLLHLIDIPNNANVTTDSTEKMLNNDIRKLNAILKGTYYDTNELTAREKLQIRIVKENIHNFIVSVGKFANILHEVLGELYKNNKKYECQRNLRLNKKYNSQKTLNKIKKLLQNYNVVQNTFMKRIFQLIKNAQNNTSSESPLNSINDDNSLNNAPVIDTYTTNIIEHLKKLKNLAQAINSTRRKRWTIKNNDAMEFMLLVLEYMLKQNQPLEQNTHPANDGIDVLIEAIQNAPSIKSIQKKVLDYNYTKWYETIQRRSKDPRFVLTGRRTTARPPTTTEVIYSEPVKRSNEDLNDETSVIKYDNDSVSRDENVLGDRATIDLADEIKEKAYQRGMETSGNSSSLIDFPEIPEENISKNDTIEKVGFSETVSNLAVKKPDNDTVISYEEDNNYIVAPITVAVTDAAVDTNKETTVPWEDYKLDLIPVTNKEINFDWMEENFEKEMDGYRSAEIFTIKPVSEQTVSILTTTTMATPTTTAVVVSDRNVDDVSGLTAEIFDENKRKVITDIILHRKEMDLLNSLDYGTDLPEFDDSISKDGVKSAEISFPSYTL